MSAGVPGAAIEARALACGHGGRAVLAELDFAIEPGSFVGVLGPNGAGKSTLLRTLAGLLPPLAGEALLGGVPVRRYEQRALARLRAYMAQQAPAEEGWRVEELVAMGRFPHQRGWGLVPGASDREAVERALERTGVAMLRDRPIETLSGGQRQRVHLARALAQGAAVLFLDEPTAHLDLTHQLAFHRLVRELQASDGLTVVAVLHDLNLAAQFCQRLLVVGPALAREEAEWPGANRPEEPGRLLADGGPDGVIEPELIARAFGLRVQVRRHPVSGLPYVLPQLAAHREPGRSARLRAAERERLHVICGGGSGERLLPGLYRLGYVLSVGVVNLLDSDQALAVRLGADVVAEAPFSAVSFEAAVGLEQRLREAAGVVVAEVAWGQGNIENLRVLARLAAEPGAPRIWLVADQPILTRDFTGGEAAALWERLRGLGARQLSLPELLVELEHEGDIT